MGRLSSLIESILASSVTWEVIALIIGAIGLSGRFSVKGATGILLLAGLIALAGVYRADPVLRLPWIPRLLIIMALGSL